MKEEMSLKEHHAYLEYLGLPYADLLKGATLNTDSHLMLIWRELVLDIKAKWTVFKKRPFFIIIIVVVITALPVP